MDKRMYNAAMEGELAYDNFSVVDHLKREEELEMGYPVTPNGNTILHVAALFGQRNFVGEVLTISPALLCYKNKKNETALHIAADVGQSELLRIQGQETVLVRMKDDIGDTALHKAVRSGHIHIVRILVKLLLNPHEHDFPANNAGETPLYLAAESGFYAALIEILSVCEEPTHVAGPLNRTPLHAAIIQEHTDNDGNTPLHFLAAYGNHAPQSILFHPSVKKMTFNKLNQTPLDMASSRTHTTEKEKLVAVLLEFNARLGQRCDSEVQRQSENSRKIQEMRKYDDEATAKREKLKMEKILKSTEIQVVVATLIMTVAFAAGFTLPGGLDNDNGPNKGMSILLKKTAFRVFVISDVLAFTCAAAAIYIYSAMANCDVVAGEINVPLLNVLRMNYNTASTLQGFAMAAVVVAFVTGIYATLENSLPIAVTVCVIACVYFPIFVFINRTWDIVTKYFRHQTIHELFTWDVCSTSVCL